MNRMLLIFFACFAGVALVSSAASIHQTLESGGGFVRFTTYVEPPTRVEPTEEQEQAAAREASQVLERIAQKTAIAQQVVRGELTLVEAAARYRQLHAASPLRFPGADERDMTADERYCRNVINFVRYSGNLPRPLKEAAADRLEEELTVRLCVGAVQLPPTP